MRWRVWCPDLGQSDADATIVEASYPDVAATRWAEEHDRRSADYSFARGSDMRVCVQEDGGALRFREFSITAELIARYSATDTTRAKEVR